jgi:hypothetical protein
MPTLTEIAARFPTDKGALGYTVFYERHFKPLRRRRLDLLEVGTSEGGSLRMWAEWAPRARIVGVDIAPLGRVDTDRIETVVADVRGYTPDRTFDIIVDDGSHNPSDILAAYERLWPSVKPGGFYAVEDLEVHAPQYSPLEFQRDDTRLVETLAGMFTGVCHGDGRGVFANPHGHPQWDVPSATGVFAMYAYPRLVILEKER